ncbi:hypothetical protein EJF36_16355 [Bacillus sp. HMF5848]|uniref:DUF6671 family protein n=1 Tax=Bacillus sp. HMF5848 TaxID=2495421 RepID=UPI000F77623C|nr:DUF6671 family protein [Bacillus sp. HMF5848]RSK28306.1 hypothetical protein EJF36_16355 [Bacillus sp. HMF5848]
MKSKDYVYSLFKERMCVLASMHKKENVMSPVLEEKLGVKIIVPKGFNTDQFGTFTRDIQRIGTQLEAAKLKAGQALIVTGEKLAIASEGSFGPHPYMPFAPLNREVVYMLDTLHGFEVWAEHNSTQTNYLQQEIMNIQEAFSFCQKVGFPNHAVVVRTDKETINEDEMVKGINSKETLEEAIRYMLKKSNHRVIFIETDMRAMFNPTRMEGIKTATEKLIEKIYSICPNCSFPGYDIVTRKPGLVCIECGLPTKNILSHIYDCKKCGHSEEKLYPKGKEYADPMFCDVCNP